eukprot:XP_024446327.1 glycine-rich protein 23-like [Populus trichocarpa]
MGLVTGHRVVGALLCAFLLNALVVADHVTTGDKDDKHFLGGGVGGGVGGGFGAGGGVGGGLGGAGGGGGFGGGGGGGH